MGIEDDNLRSKVCDKVVAEGLSVRETERLAEKAKEPAKKRSPRKQKNPDLAKVESDLKEALGTRVNIKYSGKKGKIIAKGERSDLCRSRLEPHLNPYIL